ncbi:MAG: sortase [Chloroflexia bacterium]|nr:sortase [Chloroflexia bacterium]
MIRLIRHNLALSGLLILGLALVLAPKADGAAALTQTLLTPSGAVSRIVIPKIRVDSKVVEVAREKRDGRVEWQVADYAAGHHAGSGVPGGGSNVVISGHNNIRGAVFRRLDELRKGDRITLESRHGERFYKVSEVRIVLQDGARDQARMRNARVMAPTPTEQLTLISCWPYQPWPPYRIIVIALPV